MVAKMLAKVLADATSVRVSRVGAFDPRRRSRSETLFAVREATSLDRLRRSLEINEASLAEGWLMTTPGDLDFNFLKDHDLIARVTFIYPDYVRWLGWDADAKLRDPDGVVSWLEHHGWHAPPSTAP
jgi:hypothetical protein